MIKYTFIKDTKEWEVAIPAGVLGWIKYPNNKYPTMYTFLSTGTRFTIDNLLDIANKIEELNDTLFPVSED